MDQKVTNLVNWATGDQGGLVTQEAAKRICFLLTTWPAFSSLGENCINFDGANDYLDGYGLMRVMDTKGSISFWFNQDAETDSVLMGMAQSDENTKIEIKTKTTRKLGINVKLDGDTEWEVETSGTYDAFGSWNHVVITHDGIAVKIYLNGSFTIFR